MLCMRGSVYMQDYIAEVLKILVRYMKKGGILSRGCVDAGIALCRALGCCTVLEHIFTSGGAGIAGV